MVTHMTKKCFSKIIRVYTILIFTVVFWGVTTASAGTLTAKNLMSSNPDCFNITFIYHYHSWDLFYFGWKSHSTPYQKLEEGQTLKFPGPLVRISYVYLSAQLADGWYSGKCNDFIGKSRFGVKFTSNILDNGLKLAQYPPVVLRVEGTLSTSRNFTLTINSDATVELAEDK
ncbi:hypothetical protein [Desulfobacter vibrioformis]|uniref:hypothetical protein n=1 Tax=Desulfobacter vibrioformis TaxID=34031 RepID=UPI0012EB8E21|nr:hypothetical protein [Desulfobacter vibrioformis]